MLSLDLFLNSLSVEEYENIKSFLPSEVTSDLPLLSSDFHANFFTSILFNFNIQKDLSFIQGMAKNYKWKNNFKKILNENVFESIVVTDASRKIIWVNDGFSKMTGYSKNYALDKSPSFLQGRKTSEETRQKIRKKLSENKPFKEVVLNYKKDQTAYKCELQIFPLYNNNKITHFMALEKQVA